jgi:MFS family permease
VLLVDTVGAKTPQNKNVLHDVAEGLRHCWDDVMLRTCFIYWAAIMLLVAGPVQVAMPVLATRLGDSAAGFGGLVGANAAGALLGMFLSGAMPRIRTARFGLSMLAIDFTIGLLFIPMALIGAIWQGLIILLAIGTLSGFMQVRVYTWMQQRVPRAMLGRAMSIFMFIFLGITPISAAVTGWLMRGSSTSHIFEGSGMALVIFVLLALWLSPLRQIAD